MYGETRNICEGCLMYDEDTDRQNSAVISRPVSLRFATRCLCCNQSGELWCMNHNAQNTDGDAKYIRNSRSAWDAFRDTTP
jgi:hypothetical protein